MFEFHESLLDENRQYLAEYVEGITIPYDDFLEEHILQSKIFSIHLNQDHLGFFGVLNKMLTILFITDEFFEYANAIFDEIKMTYQLNEAFVPTSDMKFMSIVLEKYTQIEIQAFHFSDTKKPVRPPEFGKEYIRCATEHDLAAIIEMAGDFQPDYDMKIKKDRLYVLEYQAQIIGLGVLIDNVIMQDCIGTGMFTRTDWRGKGVGRSIILFLKDIVHHLEKTPVPGCWYYNVGSKKTLESAGYISKSKLLKITF